MEIALNKPDAVLIAGPTASGKSALGLLLAERLGGAIVNADAMQVYRELRVVSARPSVEEEAQVPHYLYGFASAYEAYSVARWASHAADVLAEVRQRGLVPIFVGGTGLYFAVLLKGLSPIPEIHASIRVEARMKLQELGNQRFHAGAFEARSRHGRHGLTWGTASGSCGRGKCWRLRGSRSTSGRN
jgi:tRNA dimethylallyltransferase